MIGIQQTTGGIDPGKGVHAHHVFPKKHRSKFADAGMNIHDPQYGVWWEAKSHMEHARAYNDEWGRFFQGHPQPTLAEILQQGRDMMKKHGITVRY